jgi:hypothetical protein
MTLNDLDVNILANCLKSNVAFVAIIESLFYVLGDIITS